MTVKVILKLSLSPSSDTPVMFSVCNPGVNLFTSNTNVPFPSAPVGGHNGIHCQRSSWVDKESANRSPLLLIHCHNHKSVELCYHSQMNKRLI